MENNDVEKVQSICKSELQAVAKNTWSSNFTDSLDFPSIGLQ